VINILSKFDEFSATQIKQLVEFSLQNGQVKWIFGYGDTYEFYTNLVKNNKKVIADDLLESIERVRCIFS